MANSIRSSVAAICFLALASTAQAATYYVRTGGSDTSQGHVPAKAFKTINQAAEVATGGDVVYVGAGAYPDPVFVLGVKTNGLAVRFVADVTGAATGDSGTVLVSGTTFRVAGSNGVQIEGFTFFGGSSHPVIWQDSYDGTFKDCVFSGGDKSLLVKNGSLTIDACQFSDFKNDAIQVDGTAKMLVRDCTITGSARRGIDIRKNAYVVIENSSVTNCTGDGVHVEVTGDVIPVSDISVTSCQCEGDLSPLDLKKQAYDILHGMHPADVGFRQLINNAANKVRQTLHPEPQLWTDGWHVSIPEGPNVYTKSSEVIEQLNAIYHDDVDFDIIGDELSVNHPFVAKVTVLGAAISYGTLYDAPVTVQIKIGSQTYEPFGSFTSPTQGNVNDNNNPRTFEPEETFDQSDSITIAGRSWLKKSTSNSGSQDSHWYTYLNVTAATRPNNLQLLRDGDAVPNLGGVHGQNGVASFLTNYIDENGKIKLTKNQAIVLFELGTTNLSSTAADFQDLVTLISLRRSITPLTAEELALIKQAMELLLEADRTLANCAITEGNCAGADAAGLADAAQHYGEGMASSTAEQYVDASADYRQAWEDAKKSSGNQDIDFSTTLAAQLQPTPPTDLITISNPQLTVNNSTLTGNGTGLWIVTQQNFASQFTDYSNNTDFGLHLFGTSHLEHCTINGNGVGGLWLNQTGMNDLTVDNLTIANNTQYGVYAEASDLTFDGTNIGDWSISGSQIGVAAVGGDSTFQGVTMSGGSTAAVQLTQGNMQANNVTFSASGYGLAIDASNVALTNCTFTGNKVGLYANRNAFLSVSNSNFTANSLWGASVTPSGTTGETATFSGCTFTSNTGGLTLVNAGTGDVMLRDATVISDNTAAGLHFEQCNLTVDDQAAGANWSTARNLYGISSNQSTLVLSKVIVRDSQSYGVRCQDSTVTLNGCTVIGRYGIIADLANDALTVNASILDSGSTPGVGLSRYGGTLDVTNSTFDGYWLALYLSSVTGSDSSTILHCTIANSEAYGVYLSKGSAVIRNSILTGDRYGLVQVEATLTHTHNLLHGFSTPFYGTSAHATELLKTPRFVDAANGDLHLDVGSAAINAGTDLSSSVSTDLEGNARPSFDGYEMGAYEFTSPNGSFRVLDWTEKR